MARRLTRNQAIRLLSERLRAPIKDNYEFHYLLRDLMQLSGWGDAKDVPLVSRRSKLEEEVAALEANRI